MFFKIGNNFILNLESIDFIDIKKRIVYFNNKTEFDIEQDVLDELLMVLEGK